MVKSLSEHISLISKTKMVSTDLQLTLENLTLLARMEAALDDRATEYPFNLHEQAKFTQHQITLYLADYCRKDRQNGQRDWKNKGNNEYWKNKGNHKQRDQQNSQRDWKNKGNHEHWKNKGNREPRDQQNDQRDWKNKGNNEHWKNTGHDERRQQQNGQHVKTSTGGSEVVFVNLDDSSPWQV